jgi:hypothetical protein
VQSDFYIKIPVLIKTTYCLWGKREEKTSQRLNVDRKQRRNLSEEKKKEKFIPLDFSPKKQPIVQVTNEENESSSTNEIFILN